MNLAQSARRTGLALALCLAAPHAASAMGESYSRPVEKASIAPCQGGRLLEQLFQGGNIHGFAATYFLACMRSPTEADWVLLSGTSCDDPSDNPKRCNTRKAKALPDFTADPNFWEAGERSKPPYSFKYNLVKFGLGRNCRVITQKVIDKAGAKAYSRPEERNDESWVCDHIEIHDGTINPNPGPNQSAFIENPKSFRVVHLTTTGSAPLKTYADNAFSAFGKEFSPVDRFVIPEANYRYTVD